MDDQEKADAWNQRNKGQGEPYKRHITDPLIIELAEPYGKVVLEQGCGNGHLAKKLAEKRPKKIILLDLYETNLEYARRNLADVACELEFVQADLNRSLSLDSSSVDIVTSSMTLPEIENPKTAIQETFRVLRPGGTYILLVTHPAYALKKYLEEKLTGEPPKKIVPSRDYFDRCKSVFCFTNRDKEKIKAPHYNRTIQDYTDALLEAGFKIERPLEPEITKELLEEAPRFEEEIDCPISLLLKLRKL
ncbi:class I SAM-dependent methyltransferase [Candidatus Woesearchaeota archaeon]|nr:class I SAM-dependent methyltransferase [Candidatus Woesearchaeota archaeon]